MRPASTVMIAAGFLLAAVPTAIAAEDGAEAFRAWRKSLDRVVVKYTQVSRVPGYPAYDAAQRVVLARDGDRRRVLEDDAPDLVAKRPAGLPRVAMDRRRDQVSEGEFNLAMTFGHGARTSTDLGDEYFFAWTKKPPKASSPSWWYYHPITTLFGDWRESPRCWLDLFPLADEGPSANGNRRLASPKNQWGILALEVDPRRGGMPVSWRLVQGADDWRSQGYAVKDLSKMGPRPTIPAGPIEGRTVELEALESANYSGIWFPRVLRWRENVRATSGKVAGGEVVVTVSELKSAVTDQDLSFATPLPEGSAVKDIGQPGLAFEWHGGKIVPSADPVAQKEAAKLAGRPLRRNGWIWPTTIICGILGACAIGFWWWRARQSGG